MSLRRAPAVTGAIVATCVLLAAAAAYAATSINFSGNTSQGRSISFTLSGHSITKLQYHINDRCPDGTTLFVHNFGFSPLAIKHSKFGATFTARAPQSAKTTIAGRVAGNTVSGTLSDRTRSDRTQQFCTGKATFKLTHRGRRSAARRS